MLTMTEYKKKYIDKQGKAPAVLVNTQGESLYLGDVNSITSSNGRVKGKWKALNVPDQWHDYTHIALLGDGEVVYLQEITPLNFDGKTGNVEVTFYE